MTEVRFTVQEDAPYLKRWLSEPGVLRWFPMINEREVDDAVRIWIGYCKIHAALTAEQKGVPCGMANLYIQPYKKLAHQCLFSIIVGKEYRGEGVGTLLIQELIKLAKEKFHIEILHLEVYEDNPALSLYRKMGFVEFGKQTRFIKEDGKYSAKILMQKDLRHGRS